MDVVFAVRQEVHGLSEVGSPAHPLSDGLELLAAGEEKEHAHRHDVEVEGKDFDVQPSHHLRLVDDALAAAIEHDAGLDHEDAADVEEDLRQLAKMAEDFPVLSDEQVTHVVEDHGEKMSTAGVSNQPILERMHKSRVKYYMETGEEVKLVG